MLFHLLRHAFLILYDSLNQLHDDLVALNEAIELSIHVFFDTFDLTDEEGTVFEVLALALLDYLG